MERKLSFSQFASITESQILDDAQMNMPVRDKK